MADQDGRPLDVATLPPKTILALNVALATDCPRLVIRHP